MARRFDVQKLKETADLSIRMAISRLDWIDQHIGLREYNLVRWSYAMTAVELYAIWERYAEDRLIGALNHHPTYFLEQNGIRGVKRVSKGFASYAVRGGNRFFDFRTVGDLKRKAKRLVGDAHNPFALISGDQEQYLDALATIRNQIVHASAASTAAYKKTLKGVYGITSTPTPDEFLKAKDMRTRCPAPREERLAGLIQITTKSITAT